MKALARIVIQVAMFIEMSDDDVLDLDSAVRTLEGIAQELGSTGQEERTVLREAIVELIDEEMAGLGAARPRQEVVGFYKSFMENFGLDAE